MQSIDFYTLPSTNYYEITPDDACIWTENIEEIEYNDKLYVPNEFYYIPDNNGVTATDFLYSQANDVNTYIMQVLCTKQHVEDTYEILKAKEKIGYLAYPRDTIEADKIEKCVKESKTELLNIKRAYALKSKSYQEYIEWFPNIFPDLIFHEHSCVSIEKLGDFKNNINELHRHLCALNDYGKKVYFETEKDEGKALSNLGIRYGIICSGKGSNETTDFKVIYNGIKITCNPHTKLKTRYSDQRIYFCWGRDDIDNHKIIIAKIGNHWKM